MSAPTPRERAVGLQRSASEPAVSAWVGASAGTGKTRVLTDRVLRLLLEGTRPEHILCLTFTKAAAAEMSLRLSRDLSAWAVIDDADLGKALETLTGAPPDATGLATARQLFARVLDAPGGVKIQTIHAFCQALLKRFPLEAGVPPHFTVMEERDALDLMNELQREVLGQALMDGAGEPIRKALAVVTEYATETSFAELMGELTASRGRLNRLLLAAGSAEALVAAIYRQMGVGPDETPESVLAPACTDHAFDHVGLKRAAAAMLEASSSLDQTHGQLIADWLAASREDRPARLDHYRLAFFTKNGKGERRATLIHTEATAAAPGSDEVLAREADRLTALQERLDAIVVARASAGLMLIGGRMLEAYERHKRARAMLDFDDLILKSRALLEKPDAAPWVLYKLDGGIAHLLIDEAQDTNPDQWRVVQALTEEFFAGEGAHESDPERPRTVFAVGDVKQSIFSFQGADPDEFAAMQAYYQAKVEGAGLAWRPVGLDVSFRSTAAVLEAVDRVFGSDRARAGVAAEGETIRHISERAGKAGLVELWPPVRPQDEEDAAPWRPPVDRVAAVAPRAQLAERIAGTIAGWIEDGEILASRGRPVRASDVMVLVRRRKGFVDELVRALRGHKVPVAGVDRMLIGEELAVMDLIALGRFVLLPRDDLNLAALLKSPLVGLDEDRLFALAHGRGNTSLWATLGARRRDDPAFARAHKFLAGCLARADFVPPYELYGDLVEGQGGRAALASRLGHEAEDAIDEFLALALAYERSHTPSLEGFLHWLETGETEVKRDLEQGARNEVRILTVHGSKGLQAPIVFLADTMAVPPADAPKILWPDAPGEPHGNPAAAPVWAPLRGQEHGSLAAARAEINRKRDEEYRRLLYVALTRAEDRLYVCGWETKRKARNAWYELIAEGLSDFGTRRDFDFGLGWQGEGLRHETGAPAGQPEKEGEPDSRGPAPGWISDPPPPEPDPPRPFAPSRPAEEDPPVQSPLGEDDGTRFRRGLLIHRLLQSLPDMPAEERAEACGRYLAHPALGLDPSAREALAAEALAVLEKPEFAAFFGAGSMAEVPLTGLVDGFVVSGQVDRLAVTADEVTVLDFKTNRPAPGREADIPAAYGAQMAAYRALLRAVYPGRRVRCALLWTDGPRLMTLSDALLDAHAPGVGAASRGGAESP